MVSNVVAVLLLYRFYAMAVYTEAYELELRSFLAVAFLGTHFA